MSERWVTLRMHYETALSLQQELSDLTCWCRGFRAGANTNLAALYDPIGVSAAQTLNTMLKEELRRAEGIEDEEPIF